MKPLAIIVLFSGFLISCSTLFRNFQVDNEKLLGGDYRLFQNTPAWELVKAVQDCDGQKIEKIVSDDPKLINYQEQKFGYTLLMVAIRNTNETAVQLLLKNHADISIHDKLDGASALIIACNYSPQKKIKIIEMLLQYGADPNDVEVGPRKEGSSIRYSALSASAKGGSMDAVRMLVERGAKINYEDEFRNSALIESVSHRHYNIALYLLNKGADYTKPIYYYPEKSEKRYILDVLRDYLPELNTEAHKSKMEVVAFLRSKGIEYKNAPVPTSTLKLIKKKYPENWQEYLEKY